MPNVRGILVSDIHLQARAPIARSPEPDWFEAMARPLAEIEALAEEHDAPVVYAGDIFDRWNSSAEVINFALERLPRGFAVPGQHDLPHHNYDDIKRSAYWTLVEADHITNLEPGDPTPAGELTLYGWPWGFDARPPGPPLPGTELTVAVVHRYVWTRGTGYPGAPDTARVGAYHREFGRYDVAAFGDNHIGFISNWKDGGVVCNCGGLMRRKTDEREYRPGVGLLLNDGTVERHYLDTSQDEFIRATEAEEMVEQLLDMGGFLKSLRDLGVNEALDFTVAVRRFLHENPTADRVAEIILSAIE